METLKVNVGNVVIGGEAPIVVQTMCNTHTSDVEASVAQCRRLAEAGAELIGSINGKTSVANQQQIIEGIASGVERANSEQNTLLRQQNELLRGILEKDASVRIGASAALGRVARQSLDMYGSLIGG